MTIEELRKIKNRTAAQQNELTFLEMKACTNSASSFLWLQDLLSRQGCHQDEGILILLSDIPEKFGTLWYGTWLTAQKEFFEFVVATTRDDGQILKIESWEKVAPEVTANKEGFGKTPAYIALELLSEIKG